MSDTGVTDARRGDARPDAPSDAELIRALRGGDVEAYGELYARHVDSARRLARSLSSDGEADDLVSEAFAKVLVVLQRGEGPDTALRPYLLTALRRLHVDRVRSLARTRPTGDIAAYDEGEEFQDTVAAGFENHAAARAFASLPERWQLVLWHLEVEGQKPADVAPLLGISANSVSALAYRAREGLRQAFVAVHAQVAENERCATTRAQLGAFIRNDISKRDGAAVEAHLRDCRECAGVYLELVEVNSDLRALIAPLILGSAAAVYLGGSAAAGAVGGSGAGLLAGVGGFLGKGWGKTLAGVAAAGVVVAGVVVGVQSGDDRKVAADSERVTAADRVDAPTPAEPGRPAAPVPVRPSDAAPLDDPADPEPRPTQSERADDQGDPDEPDQSDQPGQHDQSDDADDADEPTGQPIDAPTGTPSAGTDAVETSAQPTAGGLVWDVAIRVNGLAATEPGTVTVTLDRPALAVHLDPRCDLLNPGRLTCRLEGPGTVRLLVTPMPGAATILTATLMPGDRRSSVRLG